MTQVFRQRLLIIFIALFWVGCGSDDPNGAATDVNLNAEINSSEDVASNDTESNLEDVSDQEDANTDQDLTEMDVIEEVVDANKPQDVVPGKDVKPDKDVKPNKDILPPKDGLPGKDTLPPKDSVSTLDVKPPKDSLPMADALPPKDKPAIGIDGICIPNCENKECGPDGCGNECGECLIDEVCSPLGNCKPSPIPMMCGNQGFEAFSQGVNTMGAQNIGYVAYSSATYPTEKMTMEILPGSGGPTEPGSYTINTMNYATCGLCITIRTYGQNMPDLKKIFLAKSGDVEITSMGDDGLFTGTMSNVMFKEVTLDGLTSVPVLPGESWCIESYSFEAEFP